VDTLASTAKQLLADTGLEEVKIRLLGISVSNFGELQPKAKPEQVTDQLKLFND
jgi:DNA polymerase-4